MSEKKKILYLMEYPIDLPGGGQMSTQTLCEGLAASGKFEPVVCCPNLLNKKAEDYPFKIVTYDSDENRELSKWSRISNFLKRIKDFKRIVRQENPDLVHVSMSESLITYGALVCTGHFKKIPFVYTDRGLRYGYRKHSMFCILRTMKHASMMLTTTEFNKSLWDKEDIPCKIHVIPNTISCAFDDFAEGKRDEERAKHGIKEGELVIGFAGRISEEKDWGAVPGIVGALADAGVKFKVALVLSVYEDRDEEIKADLINGIKAHIGEENLIYQQDLSQAEISDYYYMVDIFVMTSMFESFGKAAVEAMSRKCAVLSTAVGGLPEVIGRKEDLYDKEDLKTFTDRVRELSENGELLDKEREYFYNRFKTLYTRDVNTSRHEEVYGEILKDR